MNITKHEQRVLHELAFGGEVKYARADNEKVQSVQCYTRDGFAFATDNGKESRRDNRH